MLFSPDLTLSQALMAMPHPLPGLSSQLQPPCSENKKANCNVGTKSPEQPLGRDVYV